MFCTAGHHLDAGHVQARVVQHIGQLGDVLLNGQEYPGEQIAQVVRENFFRCYPGQTAQFFHRRLDVATVHAPPRAGDEYGAGFIFPLYALAFETMAQLLLDDDLSLFSLVYDFGHPACQCLNCDIDALSCIPHILCDT